MHVIIGILGALQLLGGLATWLASRSAMHETTAATLIGFGVLALGLAAILSKVDGIASRIDAREAGDIDRHATMERMAGVFDRLGQRKSDG